MDSAIPAGLGQITQIAAGEDVSIALRQDGTLAVWGVARDGIRESISRLQGLAGVLSIGGAGGSSLGISVAGAPTKTEVVIDVSSGRRHCLSLTSHGEVLASGSNDYGQCEVPAGLHGVIKIAAGDSHSLALRNDGTVAAWGSNLNGQVDVPEGLAGVVSIVAGGQDSAAYLADGSAIFWGALGKAVGVMQPRRRPGQLARIIAIGLGDSHAVAYDMTGGLAGVSLPLDDTYRPVPAPSDLDVVLDFAVGPGYCLALTYRQSVAAWGRNDYGQCDIPDDLPLVTKLAAGGGASLALLYDGRVVSWGYRFDDPNETPMPEGLADVVDIAAGQTCLALKRDGTVVAWGNTAQVDVAALVPK